MTEVVLKDSRANLLFNRAKSLTFAFYYDENFELKNGSDWKIVIGFVFKPTTVDDRDYMDNFAQKMQWEYSSYELTKCLFSCFEVRFPESVCYRLASQKFQKAIQEFIEDHPISKIRFLIL